MIVARKNVFDTQQEKVLKRRKVCALPWAKRPGRGGSIKDRFLFAAEINARKVTMVRAGNLIQSARDFQLVDILSEGLDQGHFKDMFVLETVGFHNDVRRKSLAARNLVMQSNGTEDAFYLPIEYVIENWTLSIETYSGRSEFV